MRIYKRKLSLRAHVLQYASTLHSKAFTLDLRSPLNLFAHWEINSVWNWNDSFTVRIIRKNAKLFTRIKAMELSTFMTRYFFSFLFSISGLIDVVSCILQTVRLGKNDPWIYVNYGMLIPGCAHAQSGLNIVSFLWQSLQVAGWKSELLLPWHTFVTLLTLMF